MSFLSRLRGSRTFPVEVPPPPFSVAIPQDLVAPLTAGGAGLADAVEATLRKAIEDQHRPGEGLPFWLARDQTRSGEMEQELRDRVAQRRAGESER